MAFHGVARPPLEETDSPALLLLLHGLASDENDLIGLAGELDPSLYVVSLRAPFKADYGGYAWFDIKFLTDGSRIIDDAQALASCEQLIEELSGLPEALEITPSKIIVAGFSQGAMMAAGIVLRRPDLVDAAWLMSGRYLPVLDPQDQPARPLPILVQHGLYDDVLSVDEGRELAGVLKAKGHDVRHEEYAMAHQVGYESLRDADAWLRAL